MDNRILRLPEVKSVTGLSRSSIYLSISKNEFPKPIRLGIRSVGWSEREIQKWLSSKISSNKKRCL